MSNLTSTTDLNVSGNLVCGGNSILGSSSSNTLTVNSNTTFYNTLNTNGITDTSFITTTGDLSCSDITCSNITASGSIDAVSITSPLFTGTTTMENLIINGNLTCNNGLTLPSTSYTPSLGMLGYFNIASFAGSPQISNRLITSNSVFNVHFLTLAPGSYIIYYKATLGLTSGSCNIASISHGLSTTSSSQVAPTQIYDGNFDLNFNDNQTYTIYSTEIRAFVSNTTIRFNFLCSYTGNNLFVLGGSEYGSLNAIRIA